MLEGDYINEHGEHHEWGKLVLTGDETNISISDSVNGIKQFNIPKIVYKNPNTEEITARSNYFLGVKWDKSWTIDNCICNTTNGYSIRIMTSEYTTVEDFKTGLKSKYEAGNPVTIYYKLATPIELELTEEQKKVKKEIDDTLHTYKGTTHITISSGEINAIANVEYLKDTQTYIDNQITTLCNSSSSSDTTET